MTEQEIQDLPIEKIIYLPNFVSLESKGGIENAKQYEPIRTSHWEIIFKAESIGNGRFQCFGRIVQFSNYRVYELKDLPQQAENQ